MEFLSYHDSGMTVVGTNYSLLWSQYHAIVHSEMTNTLTPGMKTGMRDDQKATIISS